MRDGAPGEPRALPAGERRPGGTALLSAMAGPGAPGTGQGSTTAPAGNRAPAGATEPCAGRSGLGAAGRGREGGERPEGRDGVGSEGREAV